MSFPGNTHFSGTIVPPGPTGTHCDKFPDHLPPPQGWEWLSNSWNTDSPLSPTKYGIPDAEGWLYGISFDRLNEAIRSGTASGAASKTNLVRKRRWTRSIRCVSEELLRQIRSKCERMARMRSRIEKSLQEKETVIAALRLYEAKR